MDNGAEDDLNTAEPEETEEQKAARLRGEVPVGSIPPIYDPLDDAKCVNEPYEYETLTKSQQLELYHDFTKIFDWGFENTMGSPLQSTSLENNGVTNNRFPGMYLRMCFHDNSINRDATKYQDNLKSKVLMGELEHFNADPPLFSLQTSGADASVLVCPKERYHPNQNYDQTATRVLHSMTNSQTGIMKDGQSISLIDKWGLSYSDLLQNGCLAATAYLTEMEPEWAFKMNPMKVGRKDACYKPKDKEPFALCGPTELLPGLSMSTTELNDWFVSRHMTECMWMSLMWTHTTLDSKLLGRKNRPICEPKLE
jgi:hypothetical protein